MFSTVVATKAPTTLQRQRWLAVLAKAERGALESVCKPLGELPRMQWLRRPETGLVMVRGRVGGTGAKFNLGEVPVTRCAVKLDSGTVGIAWVQGRDAEHATLAARLDALLQEPQHCERIHTHVIEPLAAAQAARREGAARKAAATKVAFYTLAREAQSGLNTQGAA
jgi:alpha-D-ribose 1-methylphosphonate 5-triphosphate synthase subunit PhnG